MGNMYLDVSIPLQVGLLLKSLKKALGPMLYKLFEKEIVELVDGSLEDTLKNLATDAYKQGVEDARYEALKDNAAGWAARREAMENFLFSKEAKDMGPEEKELHALRAFVGDLTKVSAEDTLDKGGV